MFGVVSIRLEEHAVRVSVRPSGDLTTALSIETKTSDDDHVVEHVSAKDVVDDTVTGHEADLRGERVGIGNALHHHGDVRAEHDTGVIVLRTLVAEQSVLKRLFAGTHVILGLGARIAVDREATTDNTDLGDTSLIGVHGRSNGEALEVGKHFEQGAHTRGGNDEVGGTTAVVDGHAVGLDDQLGIERTAALAKPTTISGSGVPEGDATTNGGGLVTGLDADVDHAGEHLTVDLSLDLVGERLSHFVIDVDSVHRFEVLLKLGRPVGGDTASTGLNGGLFDLDGHLGDASGHFELGEQTGYAAILLDEQILLGPCGIASGRTDESIKGRFIFRGLNTSITVVEEVVASFHSRRSLLRGPGSISVGILTAGC